MSRNSALPRLGFFLILCRIVHWPEADWPATAGAKNTMEGDNEYDQPEWNQAGPHADAQDLAGPGEHCLLQCTVTKPQKEGEGTQNLYVSYLVTTDV